MKRLFLLFAFLITLSGAALVLGQRTGDAALLPNAGSDDLVSVILVDHGYHAGLIFRRSDVDRIAAASGLDRLAEAIRDFQRSEFIEIGWGDEDFYRHVPQLKLGTVKFALRALFGMNQSSVLRVVGYSAELPSRMPPGIAKELPLSRSGAIALLRQMEGAFQAGATGDVLPLPASDPYGQYFAARGRYSVFNVCNHWVARLLIASGHSVNVVLATHSRGLFWQIDGRPLP